MKDFSLLYNVMRKNPCRDQGIKLPSALSSRQLLVTVQSDWKESLRACTGGATQAVSAMQVNGSETIYLGETLTFENAESFFRELTSRRWDIVRVLLSARKEYDADGVECAGLSQQDIAQRLTSSPRKLLRNLGGDSCFQRVMSDPGTPVGALYPRASSAASPPGASHLCTWTGFYGALDNIDADIERLTALGLIESDENGRLTCPFAIIRVDVVLQSIT
jgi:hypothetical protein